MNGWFRSTVAWRLIIVALAAAVAASAFPGPTAGVAAEDDKKLLDCLCRCLEPKGGQFSCSCDTEDRGWSPSCAKLANGPCICKAYGCFRGALPTEGECYDACYAKFNATPTPKPAPTTTPKPAPTPTVPQPKPTATAATSGAQTPPLAVPGAGTVAADCTTHRRQTLGSRATIGKEVPGKGTIVDVTGNGAPPDCACLIDYANARGVLVRSERLSGDSRRDYIFDERTGALVRTDNVSLSAERERIRAQYGFRHSEEEIDRIVDPQRMVDWFQEKMRDNQTETRMWHPQFWWQHLVALADSGFSGSNSDFVDTHQHGRCGHMMQWLERNLNREFDLPSGEAALSITGEKYRNLLNHTALLIRPQGISNAEWGEMVMDLKLRSGGNGLRAGDLGPLGDALVIDPYFKKVTTVREFITGWSVIRVS